MTAQELNNKLRETAYPTRILFEKGWGVFDEKRGSLFAYGHLPNRKESSNPKFIAIMEHTPKFNKRIITIYQLGTNTSILPVVAKLFEYPPRREDQEQIDGWRLRDGRRHHYFRATMVNHADFTKEYIAHGNLWYGGDEPLIVNIVLLKKKARDLSPEREDLSEAADACMPSTLTKEPAGEPIEEIV